MKTNKPRPEKAAQAAVQPTTRFVRTAAESPRMGRKTPAGKAAKAEAPPSQTARPPALKIPPILLEGDGPRPPAAAPVKKSAAPEAPAAAQLPEAYGTGRLMLVARDPHWLYAHWDLTPQQQRECNALSTDRHLVVRVQPGTTAGQPFSELHVHPESRSWFIQVERAATSYSAELGYHPTRGGWVAVATSRPVMTPPDTVSLDRTLRFATIPPEVPLRELAVSDKQMRRAERPPPEAQQEQVLAAVFKRYRILQEPASSIGIPELIRGPAQGEDHSSLVVSAAAHEVQIESVSSPLGGEAQPPQGFWLNVNAELVLYGATAPDASVTISDQPIILRPDGTFSFRFAMPDGDYKIAVAAQSTGGESRQAALKFSRRTDHEGDVGAAPPDPSLTPLPPGSP
jgi:uncharacterized protein